MTRRRLRAPVESRAVRRVFRDVYVDAALPDTLDLRVECLGLVLPNFAVACDRTAGWLYGIDTFEYRELEILPPLDICSLRDFTRMRRHGVAGKVRDLEKSEVVELTPHVRATTPLRTALDLGCLLTTRQALAALDAFVRTYGWETSTLQSAADRFHGRRGVRQLRTVIQLADGKAESPGESFTRMAIVECGLPVPTLQFSVVVAGQELYRLDLAYPKSRVCVEYDGREFHDSPAQRAADEARRRWLRDHGWTVIVVTKDDLDPASVSRWTGDLARALRLG